jgi:hypothetical protein
MSDQVVGMLISLKRDVDQNSFEGFLVEQSTKEQVFEQGEGTHFHFYKRLGADREYIWITRFPESEFSRVSRNNHPFVLTAIAQILSGLTERHAEVSPVFFAQGEPLDRLEERWNKEFGQFGPIFTVANPLA